jgi:pyruvate,orthophosphate dikinase
MKKLVYSFGNQTADGDGKMKDVLGGKGAGLAEMSRAKLPVPPGFTISTEVCNIYFQNKNTVPAEIDEQMVEALRILEERMGQKLGDVANPLLVSVRSGAKFSMPGMMDTILNLGLNDKTVVALEAKSGNARFAYDCYRRFIQMYGNVVLEVSKHDFDEVFDGQKKKVKAKLDTELTAEDLKQVIAGYKKLVEKKTGKPFPQDAMVQLKGARDAVFGSWFSNRAKHYRRMNQISEDLGTAVNVQAMVFGNMGVTSATGVGFTRNPATGEKKFYGEFLERRIRFPNCTPGTRRCTTSFAKSPTCWSSTTATFRISNSPSRTASCTCCKPATGSARVRRRYASRWKWWARA